MALEKEITNQYVELLKEMEEQMLAINQLIDYAEVKDTTNLGLKQWLDNLIKVVYDAEDVRDVIATQTHENEVSSTTRWNPFKRSLHRELDDVLCRMKRLLKQQKVFRLRSFTRSETLSRRPTSSLVDQSGVYGRDDDEEKIKKLLLSNDGSNVSVIAIVGMGGLGKTTLAQLVFNHYQIGSVFKLNKVWICVEKDFDVIKLTKSILDKLARPKISYANFDGLQMKLNDFDELQMKLRETLSGKKFLMVLDDVWNENYTKWDNLREPFRFAAQGSKIIVTTRSEKVASVMRATSTYELDPLADDGCWELFSKHAFENIQSNAYSTFKADVVKKCAGLPLAAKVLGGLLGTKLSVEEWDDILMSNIWDLSDEVLPVLQLSYHYLPSNLKRCFAFCSIVPKDFDFEREKLVLLWIAENLLQDSKDNKKRIDVGYEYLRELELRSLIQPASHKERYIVDESHGELYFSIDDFSNVRHGELYFSMHDLVNDLAKSVSRELYKSFDLGNSFNVGEKTRHFSYEVTSDDYEDMTRFKWFNEVKSLRTFLPLIDTWNHEVRLPPLLRSEIWPQLNVLRILTLASARIENLPDSIGNLKLLRYLDLSKNEQLDQLPESLASLCNLEVLNLSDCSSLTKLPSKMTQLIKLNYLNIRGSMRLHKMPLEMGRLKDLDVLTDFVLGKDSGSSIGELKGLKDLQGELRIHGLQNITHPEDALVANLKGKSKLKELQLQWDFDSDNSEDATIILENLRPHVKLKKLSIHKYPGTRLPDWSGQYSVANLASIKISYFQRCIDLSPLGQLPSLKTLIIWKCHSLVTLVRTKKPVGHFPALVYLVIHDCSRLELPQHHCFTSIEHFNLSGGSCASLRFFPLSSFPKLKDLILVNLHSIESLAVIDESSNLNLEYLELIIIGNCNNFEYFNAGKWCAPKMKDLELHQCESLKVLPQNMCNLFPSLLGLTLNQCPNLQCLLEEGLRTSLSTLTIRECPLLESQCQREQGDQDWSKIAHIWRFQRVVKSCS